MKELIQTLLTKKSTFIEGHLQDGVVNVSVQYTPYNFSIELTFEDDNLTNVGLSDDIGGTVILYGQLIGTHQLVMFELEQSINMDTINYSKLIS